MIETTGRISSAEVCRLTGVTYRKLDYWIARGWISGQAKDLGQGIPRNWTTDQIERVREIAAAIEEARAVLLAAGIGDYAGRNGTW